MKKKQNAKDKVNLRSLKRLLKSLEKPSKTLKKKAKSLAIVPYAKQTALVGLSLMLLVALFNLDSIKNYFEDITRAAIFNLDTSGKVELIQQGQGGQDELQDLSETGGGVYVDISYTVGIPDRIKYHDFLNPPGPDEYDPIIYEGVVDPYITSIKIYGDHVVYRDANTEEIFYSNVFAGPDTGTPILKEINDKDLAADIFGSTIAFIRQRDGVDNIWTYTMGIDPPEDGLEQLTFFDSNKNDIVYYFSKIVWADDRNGDWDIYMYDFMQPDPEGTPVVIYDGDQNDPQVHNNRIVWTDDRWGNKDIYLQDLDNPVPDGLQITDKDTVPNEGADQNRPDIWGGQIVWEDWRDWDGYISNDTDIYMYDINTETEYLVSQDNDFVDSGPGQTGPKITNNIIVWTNIMGPTPSGMDAKDLWMTTYSELNVLSPESIFTFEFEDIPFHWEYSSADQDSTNFWLNILVDGSPAPIAPNGLLNMGPLTYFPLKSERVEFMQDGLWEWAVAPEIDGNYENYWSDFRTIVKKTAADLKQPTDGAKVEVDEEFIWDKVEGAKNYVAKVIGLKQDIQPFYFPLNGNYVEGDETVTFTLNGVLYGLLSPDKDYSWSIAATGLDNGEPLAASDWRLEKLSYSEPRTFHRE